MNKMKLDIVIPSLYGCEKLNNCVNSILKSIKNIKNINLYIYFTNKDELTYFNTYFKNIPEIKLRFIKNYRAPDFWNDSLQSCKADAMLYINDEVEFFTDTLEIITKYYQLYFPNRDGFMGINPVNITDSNKVIKAFGVIGMKFADRFPNRKLWCPDYFRFYADFELWLYAIFINRFKFCEQAKILHLLPAFTGEVPDKIYKEKKEWLSIDHKIFKERQKLSYLWGRDYNRIEA